MSLKKEQSTTIKVFFSESTKRICGQFILENMILHTQIENLTLQIFQYSNFCL